VLCSGADGSIISNRFIRSQNAAIYLVNSDNYFDNKNGATPRNIDIIGNQFEGSWHAQNAHPFGVISARMNGTVDDTRSEPENAAYGSDWNGITHIRIKDNVFRNWRPSAQLPVENRSEVLTKRPIHGLDLRDVSDVTITGNQFFPSDQLDSNSKAIRLNDFSGVTIKDNTFHQWPGGKEQAISRSGGRDTSQNASPSPLTMGEEN
jgi:hypothetical protein